MLGDVLAELHEEASELPEREVVGELELNTPIVHAGDANELRILGVVSY